MNDERTERRVDNIVEMEVGVPVDLGWGWAVLTDDDRVIRTCKGCGVEVVVRVTTERSAILPDAARAEEGTFAHKDGCPVWAVMAKGD